MISLVPSLRVCTLPHPISLNTIRSSHAGSALCCDLFFNIHRIAKINTMGEADVVGAGGHQPFGHTMMTQITLFRNVEAIIHPDGIDRTFGLADVTSDTIVAVHHDNSLIGRVNDTDRTYVNTRCAVTSGVHTGIDIKNKVKLAIHHPGAIFPELDKLDPVIRAVFLLASYFASQTAVAGIMVDNQGHLLHGYDLPPVCPGKNNPHAKMQSVELDKMADTQAMCGSWIGGREVSVIL